LETKLESEVQIAAEEAVKPTRDLTVKPAIPKEFATTVTRTDPEEGELVKITLETGTAHESADDMQ